MLNSQIIKLAFRFSLKTVICIDKIPIVNIPKAIDKIPTYLLFIVQVLSFVFLNLLNASHKKQHERNSGNIKTSDVISKFLFACYEIYGQLIVLWSTPFARFRTTPATKTPVYQELYSSGFAPRFNCSSLQATVQYLNAKIQ